jgi:hypothetical protein
MIENSMTVCEYLFKELNSHGSDEYRDAWALQVDQMADDGWEVLECVRRHECFGMWTGLLCRPGQTGSRRKMRHDDKKHSTEN